MGLSSLATFQKTVAAAGTQERLSATQLEVSEFSVKALGANTGKIYIGDADVDSTTGYEISADQAFNWSDVQEWQFRQNSAWIDLKDVWIDSSVSAEGVCVAYVLRTAE